MFFHTKSLGVRRLSIILGVIAGCCFAATQHSPVYVGDNKLYWNLLNIALLFAIGFIAAWLSVRIIAWIIAGFTHDHSK